MASPARIKANQKWQKKAYFSTLVRFKADQEEEIRKYAADNLNGFIVEAVEEKIAKIKKADKM